jgi:ComF family protein
MQMLERLLDFLFPPRESERLVASAEIDTLASCVAPVTIPSSPFPTMALLSYQQPLVQALIVEAKFHKNRKAYALLGAVLHDFLFEWSADRIAFDARPLVFIPVPLSRKRKSGRGYNQTEELWRAAAISDIAHYAPETIERVRDTAPQTSLSGDARAKNMKGAFHVKHADAAHTYIVFDDVTTTGATLAAAVAALRDAGATSVVPLALAH